jgi:hypothetical protein
VTSPRIPHTSTVKKSAAEMVSQILEGSLNSRVTPARILPGHHYQEARDLSHQPGPTRPTPFRAVVPLSRYQSAMPGENNVWADDGREVGEDSAAEQLSFCSQPTPLVIRESKASTTEMLRTCPVVPSVRESVAASPAECCVSGQATPRVDEETSADARSPSTCCSVSIAMGR